MPKSDWIINAHSNKEAIAASVIKNQNLRKAFQIVTIEKILNEYDIFDELTDKGPIIRWSQNEEPVISNLSHVILNRVTYVPDRLFEKFTVEDREYAKREFEAYIGFSINGRSSPSKNVLYHSWDGGFSASASPHGRSKDQFFASKQSSVEIRNQIDLSRAIPKP